MGRRPPLPACHCWATARAAAAAAAAGRGCVVAASRAMAAPPARHTVGPGPGAGKIQVLSTMIPRMVLARAATRLRRTRTSAPKIETYQMFEH